MIVLTLPYPPSVNRMWRQFRGRAILSKAGREYKERASRCATFGYGVIEYLQGDVMVHIRAYMPDARRRDIDNLPKMVLDAMTAGGVWRDDSQVKKLTIERCGIDRASPRLEITVDAA